MSMSHRGISASAGKRALPQGLWRRSGEYPKNFHSEKRLQGDIEACGI